MIYQVQPQTALKDEWTRFAEREDLFFEPLEFSGPLLLDSWNKIEENAAWMRATGRVNAVHGVFIDVNPASGDKQLRALSEERTRQSCRTARLLGCENVVLHATAHPFLNGVYLDFWAKTCAEFYTRVAEEFDMNLYIENSLDAYTGAMELLMQKTASKRVNVCLDIGHAAYSKTPVKSWFEALGDRIKYLHLSDNDLIYDDHKALGDGKIDWFEADAMWKSVGSPEIMTIEVNGIGAAERSLKYLRKNKLFGM